MWADLPIATYCKLPFTFLLHFCVWLQPQIEEGPERSLIWHRVSSNQFSMLYHHVQSTVLFPFQLIKIWKLQNDHESKRQDVMEDISFPKTLKILDKPPVCAVFPSYLHIHFISSTLISLVPVLAEADPCSEISFRALPSPFALWQRKYSVLNLG